MCFLLEFLLFKYCDNHHVPIQRFQGPLGAQTVRSDSDPMLESSIISRPCFLCLLTILSSMIHHTIPFSSPQNCCRFTNSSVTVIARNKTLENLRSSFAFAPFFQSFKHPTHRSIRSSISIPFLWGSLSPLQNPLSRSFRQGIMIQHWEQYHGRGKAKQRDSQDYACKQ